MGSACCTSCNILSTSRGEQPNELRLHNMHPMKRRNISSMSSPGIETPIYTANTTIRETDETMKEINFISALDIN